MKRREPGIDWLGPGHFRVRVTVRGERRSASGWGNDADAREAKRLLLIQGNKLPGDRMTLFEFAQHKWRPSLKVRQRTLDDYLSKLNTHIIPILGDHTLTELDTDALQEWIDGKLAEGMTPANAFNVVAVLKNILRRAMARGYITSDPTRGLSLPPVVRDEVVWADAPLANRILDAFEGHPLEVAVILGIGGGLRRSEMAGLDAEHFTLKSVKPARRKAVEVYEVNIGQGYHPTKAGLKMEDTKSQASNRSLTLPEWATPRLKSLLPVAGPILTEDGERIHPQHITDGYRAHMVASGIPWVPLKNLRHTASTLELEQGVDMATVAQRRGHSTMTITYKHYKGFLRKADEDAALRVGRVRKPGQSGPMMTDS